MATARANSAAAESSDPSAAARDSGEAEEVGRRVVVGALGQPGGEGGELAGQLGVPGPQCGQAPFRERGGPGRGSAVQHGIAGEGVPELVRLAVGDHQPRPDGARQHVADHLGGELDGSRDEAPVEALAEDRGSEDHPRRGRPEVRDAALDRVDEASRHPGPLPEQFLDQEREPARHFREAGPPRHAARPHHGGHVRRRQRLQSDQLGAVPSHQAVDHRPRIRALGVPDRQHEPHRGAAHVVTEVLQHRERLGVGPVHVLDHEHAPARCDERHQAQHPLAQERCRHGLVRGPGHRPLRHEPPQHGSVGTELGGVGEHG